MSVIGSQIKRYRIQKGLTQEQLCDNRLVTRTVVETADGEINSYMFREESSVIPLLCFADEIVRDDFRDFLINFARSKPLFSTDS